MQEEFDKKNAAGAAKDLKKSELVDWRNHDTLNQVTKMAIGYFESSYSFEDYLVERNQKEGKLAGKSGSKENKSKERAEGSGGEGDMGESDSDFEEEEEEDPNASNWDRANAEMLYLGTRKTLNDIYAQDESKMPE